MKSLWTHYFRIVLKPSLFGKSPLISWFDGPFEGKRPWRKMKVIPFTPESKQRVQMHWPPPRGFLRISEPRKSTEHKCIGHACLPRIVFTAGFGILNNYTNVNRNPGGPVLWFFLPVCWWQGRTSHGSTHHCTLSPGDSGGDAAGCPLRRAVFWEATTTH